MSSCTKEHTRQENKQLSATKGLNLEAAVPLWEADSKSNRLILVIALLILERISLSIIHFHTDPQHL